MSDEQWIVINIGCIECGVSSAIVGVFADRERAKAVAKMCLSNHHWREGGQNDYIVLKLPDPEIVAAEYAGEGAP